MTKYNLGYTGSKMKYVLIMKYNKKKRESRNETHFISYIEQKGKEVGTKYIAAIKNNKKGKRSKNELYLDNKLQ